MGTLSGMSIRWKLLIPVTIILVITVAQIFLVINMNRLQQEDAVRVNVAGRQRMLSQKMTKETLNFMVGKDPAHAQAQAKTIETFEKSLQALISGGQLEISGRTAEVKPTQNAEINARLKEAAQYWERVKPVYTGAVGHLAESHQVNVSELNEISKQLLERFDAVTGMYETASAATIKSSMTLIYIGLGIYLAAAVLAWLYVQKSIIRPILTLRDAAGRIAAGNLSEDW